jgi:hypothetical protein
VANFRPQNLHGHLWLSNDATDDETLGARTSADPDNLIKVTELSVITAGRDIRSRPSTDDSNEVREDNPPKVGDPRDGGKDTESTGDGTPFRKEADIYDGSISKEDRS